MTQGNRTKTSNAAWEPKHKETWKLTAQGLNTTLLHICSKNEGAQKAALCLTKADSEALAVLKRVSDISFSEGCEPKFGSFRADSTCAKMKLMHDGFEILCKGKRNPRKNF